jgi:putative membrane protein
MKNILKIAKHDLKKITGSVVAIITILGLCIIPCLYAWFNIFSNWAPYEADATGRIIVGVANMDEGTSALGLDINVGEKIVDALAANDAIGWVFAEDETSAIEGVYSGDYYAAIVIPEGFSEDVLSFTQGNLTNPKIVYYENEKKNAIAPKITGKAKTALQEEVNAAFVETLAGYVSDAASVAEANGIDPTGMMADLSEKIADLSKDLTTCIALTGSASGLTDAAGNLIDVSGNFIGSTHDVITANDKLLAEAQKELAKIKKPDTSKLDTATQRASDIASDIAKFDTEILKFVSGSDLAFDGFIDLSRDNWVERIDKLKARSDEEGKIMRSEGFTAVAEKFDELSQTLSDISDELKALNKDMSDEERKAAIQEISDNNAKAADLVDEIKKQIKTDIDTNISKALSNAKKSLASFRKTMKSADSDLTALSKYMKSYDGSLAGLKSSIEQTAANLKELQSSAINASDILADAAGNELLQELSDMLANDEAAVAEYLANPIKMKTEVFWPIETYGSAMAPFYTVLAQWVGSLLTAVIIKVRLKRKDAFANLKLHEWYFGRFGLYLLVGLPQALIVSLGDLLYIGIQCEHPLLFVLEACVNGLVFMMINYALVFALDNIGLGAGVIVLVLQVAGSGGTYPVEVLPGIFKVLYPLMPFRYAMDAMRECIGGMYGNTYWKCVGTLMLFFAGAVVFGLLLYYPAKKLNDMIAASKAKSEIML